ncbi:hypothetical protein L1887_04641 [Cichorium endivia]|nr:hypothetical protein L1887_04641 [Cichorium endivia]
MSGCPNLDVLGRVHFLDSPFSLLGDVDISNCNLFDNCFPNDWSSLVSLWSLNIDGNNVTSLPKCIQTLPRIGRLHAGNCSKIKSIIGLPKTVNVLYINNNKSLVKVQPGQNSRILMYYPNYPKLCDMEGRYMVQSIDKVETKIIQYLGLTLDAGEGMELGLQVLHEFGIFSSFVPEKQIPSCFMYNAQGSQISFRVPWHRNSSAILGFNMCAVLSGSGRYDYAYLNTQVSNKTKDLEWTYIARNKKILMYMGHIAWLSVWRCGNMLDAGDEIVISITPGAAHQYCINLLYEDDGHVNGERKETHHVNASHQISWTDRMDKDISNYVCGGTKSVFRSDN